MGKLLNRPGDTQSLPLRVVYGDEEVNCTVEHQEELVQDDHQVVSVETEVVWAGHKPATRHSARWSA